MYVIKRTNQGGGYLGMPGSKSTYTRSLEKARTFSTEEEATRHCCHNEVVVNLTEMFEANLVRR